MSPKTKTLLSPFSLLRIACLWFCALRISCAKQLTLSQTEHEGIDDNSPEGHARIYGGAPAPRGRFPYICSLRRRADNEHVCGATAIKGRWIITAAHCVDPEFPNSAGKNPLVACDIYKRDDVDPTKRHSVAETYIPDQWIGDPVDGYDIAVLKLNDKANVASRPVLDESGNKHQTAAPVAAIGWGIEGNKTMALSEKLRVASELKYVSWTTCNTESWWNGTIKETMCCAYSSTQDTCAGDSGGPLIEPDNVVGKWEFGSPKNDLLVGITSFGTKECNGSYPGVYTSISYFKDWIACIVNKKDDCASEIPQKSPESESLASSPKADDRPSMCSGIAHDPHLDEAKELERIHGAIQNDEAEIVKEILCRGLNPNTTYGDYKKPLLVLAADSKAIESAKVILLFDVNIDAHEDEVGQTALISSAKSGSLETVKLFLDHGADVNLYDKNGFSPLLGAVVCNSSDIVKLLLDYNADANACAKDVGCPLNKAINRGSLGIVKLLVDSGANVDARHKYNDTPLFTAASKGATKIGEVLVGAGANVNARNSYGSTPLIRSVEHNRPDFVKMLLENGANVNSCNNNNWCPLHAAAEYNRLDCAKILIAVHVNIDKRSRNGETALPRAVKKGHLEFVELLVDNDANVNTQDLLGYTPLHHSSAKGDVNIVALLLEYYASKSIKNNDGHTPYDIICTDSASKCTEEVKMNLKELLNPDGSSDLKPGLMTSQSLVY